MAKKQIIIIFIVLILGLGAYYLYNSNNRENVFKYNGYDIYQTAPTVYNIKFFLKNDINPHYISIRYDPRDLDYIKVEPDLKQRLLRDEVYITLSPELTSESVIGVAEIAKIVGNQFLFNTPVKTALTYKKEDISVITCDNVTVKTSVMILQLAEKTGVYEDSDCIIVEGPTEEEIIKASTKFILDILGIAKK
ncbi:hypothetical protein J4449_02995 [Candidatus Woesearchaeota archaeon]|nr:hypothetical protein [Candidatus Woesearchaeota archaeon]